MTNTLVLHGLIGVVAALFSTVAGIIYIYDIWWGNTRPSKSAWWILTIIWGVIAFSQLAILPGESYWDRILGAPVLWISLAHFFGTLIIAISTLWRGQQASWDIWDYLCAGAAIVALILYVYSPLLSLSMAIVADFFGMLPTLRNAYKNPFQESAFAWYIESVGSIIALGSIVIWSFAQYSGVIYLICIDVTLVSIILVRREKALKPI